MELGPDGRLATRRHRARDEPVLPARGEQGASSSRPNARARSVTVFTLGPPAAEDTLREAIAWGLDRDVDIDGVLVTDPAFAGSDTLATAKALAAALDTTRARSTSCSRGRNSVDADTGQVGPELAELLDLPFLTGVRHLAIDGTRVDARASTTTVGCRPRSSCPRSCRARSGCANRRRSIRPGRAAVPAAAHPPVDRGRPRPGPVGRRRRRPPGSGRSRSWR